MTTDEPGPTGAETLVAAASLQDTMIKLTTEMRDLRGYGKHNRALIRWLGGSLLFDLILSGILAMVSVQAHDAASRASEATSQTARVTESEHSTCVASNVSKDLNRQLWDYVLDTVAAGPAQKRTPAQQAQINAQIAKFRTYISRSFADRDCDLPNGSPAPTPAPH